MTSIGTCALVAPGEGTAIELGLGRPTIKVGPPVCTQIGIVESELPPGGGFFDVRGVKIPVAVSAFAEEIYQVPRSWAEKAYPKLIHYNSFPKGTHFAAWEQPKLFIDEMRAAFRPLRKSA